MLKRYDCTRPGCKDKATCTPVLVVPAHPMSRTKFEGVRAVFWLPLCQRHFSAATVQEFLNNDAMKGVHASVKRDFDANGAIADFNAAKVTALDYRTNEFAHYAQMQEDLRQGAVLPAQARH